MKKVSILLLTLDRFEETVKTCNTNFGNHGYDGPIELLWCDNGSRDQRVIDFVSCNPRISYKRLNKKNEGIARALNQLIIRASGEFMFFMANDILMPQNWLKTMVDYAFKAPNLGLIGVQCTVPPNPVSKKNGFEAHWVTMQPGTHAIFGPTGFTRSLIEKVGGYAEEFDTYGVEDSDLNWRVFYAGLDSFYVPGLKSIHIGDDTASSSEYRKMKNEALKRASAIANERAVKRKHQFKEELPPLREPLL